MSKKASERDPAVEAIQDLTDSVATSFEVLESDQKKLAERVEKLSTDADANYRRYNARMDALRYDRVWRSERPVDLSWMPSNVREALYNAAEQQVNPTAPLRIDRDAEFRAAVGGWFLSTTMSHPKIGGIHAAEWADIARKGYEAFGVQPEEVAAAFTTGTDTLGGHWLPEPVAAEVWRLITDNSVFLRLGRRVTMTTKTLDLPTEGSSALSVSWGSENTDITDSVPASNAVDKVTLTANRLNGYAESSMEEIQDSAAALLEFVRDKLVELAGREIDSQVLEGTGSPFTGLVGNSGVNEIASGTNGDAVTYTALSAVPYKARERASREGAWWFMAPEMMAKVVGLTDDNGQPIFRFGSVAEKIPPTLLGFPVAVHSAISASRTWGTGTTLSHLYFGPPQTIAIGQRTGLAWDVSDQVLFRAYGLAMRLIFRVAVGLGLPGAWTRRLNFDV